MNPENVILDEEEQWIENHFDEFQPCNNQDEIRKAMIETAKNTMDEIRKKKTITINLDGGVIDYFKRMAEKKKIPYQTLINLYLVDCMNSKKELNMSWK